MRDRRAYQDRVHVAFGECVAGVVTAASQKPSVLATHSGVPDLTVSGPGRSGVAGRRSVGSQSSVLKRVGRIEPHLYTSLSCDARLAHLDDNARKTVKTFKTLNSQTCLPIRRGSEIKCCRIRACAKRSD